MWWWTIKTSIICLLLIFFVHYIYLFMIQNLTIPTTKDLYKKPQQDYEKMFKIINEKSEEIPLIPNSIQQDTVNKSEVTYSSCNKEHDKSGSNIASSDMKNELQNFISNEYDNVKNEGSLNQQLQYSSF